MVLKKLTYVHITSFVYYWAYEGVYFLVKADWPMNALDMWKNITFSCWTWAGAVCDIRFGKEWQVSIILEIREFFCTHLAYFSLNCVLQGEMAWLRSESKRLHHQVQLIKLVCEHGSALSLTSFSHVSHVSLSQTSLSLSLSLDTVTYLTWFNS